MVTSTPAPSVAPAPAPVRPPSSATEPVRLGFGTDLPLPVEDAQAAAEAEGPPPHGQPSLLGYVITRWPWLPYLLGAVLVAAIGLALLAWLTSTPAAQPSLEPTPVPTAAAAADPQTLAAAHPAPCIVMATTPIQWAPGQVDPAAVIAEGEPCTLIARSSAYPDVVQIAAPVQFPGGTQAGSVWVPTAKLQLRGVDVAALPDVAPPPPPPAAAPAPEASAAPASHQLVGQPASAPIAPPQEAMHAQEQAVPAQEQAPTVPARLQPPPVPEARRNAIPVEGGRP
jgi:hypothetical protein